MTEIDILAHAEHKRIMYLRDHPQALVLQEGLSRMLTCRDLRDEEQAQLELAKHLFKEGIPTDVHSLSKEQTEFLAREGAARTMLYTHIIPWIYPLPEGSS